MERDLLIAAVVCLSFACIWQWLSIWSLCQRIELLEWNQKSCHGKWDNQIVINRNGIESTKNIMTAIDANGRSIGSLTEFMKSRA